MNRHPLLAGKLLLAALACVPPATLAQEELPFVFHPITWVVPGGAPATPGVEAPDRPSAGGGGAGKANVQDLHITKWVDLGSTWPAPRLPSAAAAGRPTHEPITFHKRIDHASPLVAPPPLRNERPTESLSPNYTKIEKVAPALNAAAPVGPAIRR